MGTCPAGHHPYAARRPLLLDYYGLPDDWPGRVDARERVWSEKASHVELKIHDDIVLSMGENFDPKFFIPYVQLHEFEALMFADVEQLASVTAPISNRSLEQLAERFSEILDEGGEPEAINDHYETCPSRRILGLVPTYRKRVLGPIVTSRIGLDVLREKCSHFASWLARLEAIGAA